MRARTVVVLVLDVAVWALVIWLVLSPPGQRTPVRPLMHHRTAQACRAAAAWFGTQAIRAEARYWKAIDA